MRIRTLRSVTTNLSMKERPMKKFPVIECQLMIEVRVSLCNALGQSADEHKKRAISEKESEQKQAGRERESL